MTTCKLPVRSSFTALALLVASSVAACGDHFGGADDVDAGATDPQSPGSDTDGGGPKAPPITGTPSEDSLTEEHGIFVAPSGSDGGDGSRARPVATLEAAIGRATKVGKSVFACTGTYAEALVVADSISVIGGLDCADPLHWKTGAAPSRIASPTSPAAIAKAVNAPTRLEALDIVAPSATAPSASSIGFFAHHSPGLTIVSSKITAGNGANGTNGTNAIQLTETAANHAGDDSPAIVACVTPSGGEFPRTATCGYNQGTGLFSLQPGGKGGVSQCSGAPMHDGSPGGVGGTGGLWVSATPSVGASNYVWTYYQRSAAYNGNVSGSMGSGADGISGKDGSAPSEIGTLTSDGYATADGSPGEDGQPGAGGQGGTGGSLVDLPAPFNVKGATYAARGGAGGGAGGCPGLAGGAGTGGGASIGIALVESPIVLDGVAIASATGGAGGLGSFGSERTAGGAPGTNVTQNAGPNAAAGGNGGAAGISTNGSNGPSIGILTSGAAPMLLGTSRATPGSGAPAIDARSNPDPFGGSARTIPATPAGITADMKTL